MRKIKIFDTTLRDGEQSPGATINHREKIIIAKQLEKLGVDIIEAGFPVSSDEDFKAVSEISSIIKKSKIAALARARENDIKVAWKALQSAKKPRIHTFMSTSDIHLKEQFKISRADALKMSVEAVKFASDLCNDIEFSPMDATRSDVPFLLGVIEKTIEAGASTINVADTVGYSQPAEYGVLVKKIREEVPNIEGIAISTHCHNDLGLAVANSLAGVANGASQVECTINGLGERAGNAALEEVAMNLYARKNFFKAETNINLKEIYATSQMVSSLSGISVQRNKAIVGENAFSHESGIHQHGILANSETYEIINPKIIGKKTKLVLGKHSGKHAAKKVLEEMGFILSEGQLAQVTKKIKDLADKQKIVLEEDIVAIAGDVTKELKKEEQRVVLDELFIETGNKTRPKAKIKLVIDGKSVEAVGYGLGPVDAVSNAIKSVIPQQIFLKDYYLKAITGGTDALADVVVKVSNGSGKIYEAEAINEDIVMASAQALIKGINKALAKK
ncbi:MAG: 2-isopropylmalate synthase [Candidatus Diapherotrites archaeon]|nr:2-isopropylmalate synthase [Candidatus Diapherotrites archaeon]